MADRADSGHSDRVQLLQGFLGELRHSELRSQAITDEEHMPADVAQAMMLDPDLFPVVVFSPEGPRVAGLLGVPDPTGLIGFNPQPDLPGRIVRCDVVGTV